MRRMFCTAMFFFAIDAAFAAEPSLVTDQELSLGRIVIGDTEAAVLQRLGKPRRITKMDDFLNTRLDYPGLTVWLGEENRVEELLSTSRNHCTPAGICPGMSFAKAKKKYGTPLLAEGEGGSFMEFPSSQSPCWLQFSVSKGIVESVRVQCQP